MNIFKIKEYLTRTVWWSTETAPKSVTNSTSDFVVVSEELPEKYITGSKETVSRVYPDLIEATVTLEYDKKYTVEESVLYEKASKKLAAEIDEAMLYSFSNPIYLIENPHTDLEVLTAEKFEKMLEAIRPYLGKRVYLPGERYSYFMEPQKLDDGGYIFNTSLHVRRNKDESPTGIRLVA